VAQSNGDLLYIPELLRVKAEVLAAMPGTDIRDAEACFFDSLEWARRQSALGWQLRTVVSLGTLLSSQDRLEEARRVVRPIFAKFTGDFQTVDLLAARRILGTRGAKHGISRS
jgi:hypothetical protein